MAEITFGIMECSKCQFKLRCEECVYNKESYKEIVTSAKKEMAREMYDLCCGHGTTYIKKYLKNKYNIEEKKDG